MMDTEAFREFKTGLTLLRDNYAIKALPHMRRAVDLESMARIEETAQTVDIDPTPSSSGMWGHPIVIALLATSGLSILVNLILIVVMLARH